MKLSTIASIVGGRLEGSDYEINAMSSDTRTIKSGELFFALKGENFDGHDFISQAAKKGASGVVASRVVDTTISTILIDDVPQALIKLAQYYRQQSQTKIAAITGSCGKTTTCALLANILAASATTLASERSFNNHIGVPLTLLKLKSEYQYAVLELGANHSGEIAQLTHIVHPHVAMITNAGPAHLEGFGSMEGIACAKGEIFQGLDEKGIAILNRDDRYFDFWKKLAGPHQVLSFGLNNKADVYATALKNNDGKYQFELHLPNENTKISLQLLGQHNVVNAVAAATAAYALGVDLACIKKGLETCSVDQTCRADQRRLMIKKGIHEVAIIDDSYNANPLSVSAAIDVLMNQPGEKILVLGDMLELGESSDQWHREIGLTAAHKGIDRLFCLGQSTQLTAEAFGKKAQSFIEPDELIEALKKTVHAKATVLVKGSRGMRMELIVNALTQTN